MAIGFFTVEQWARPKPGVPSRWIPVAHLNADGSLSKAMEALEKHGKAGLYRVVQTQRCVWVEMKNGKPGLHRSHASSPESLNRLTKIFEEEKGRRPVEKARQDRAQAKRGRIG